MVTTATHPISEVWMELISAKKLAKLLVIQDVSQRQLARDIGWKSHSYVARLLNGQAKTVTPVSAARIAHRLGVGVDDLFLVKTFSSTAQSGQQHSRKKAA